MKSRVKWITITLVSGTEQYVQRCFTWSLIRVPTSEDVFDGLAGPLQKRNDCH